MGRKGNKAGEINKGKVKNEKNGENGEKMVAEKEGIGPQRVLRKKGLVREE